MTQSYGSRDSVPHPRASGPSWVGRLRGGGPRDSILVEGCGDGTPTALRSGQCGGRRRVSPLGPHAPARASPSPDASALRGPSRKGPSVPPSRPEASAGPATAASKQVLHPLARRPPTGVSPDGVDPSSAAPDSASARGAPAAAAGVAGETPGTRGTSPLERC